MELPKKLKVKANEDKWKAYWKEQNTYVSTVKGEKVFSVDTPPPYVSGKMHMGHAVSYSQGDFIVRFKRMQGFTIFFPFGTDDNGLPTERYVEKLKGIDSKQMPREEFVKLCSQTVKEVLPALVQPWKDLGISADFENAYSTIDQRSIRVSQNSFLDLYKKGLTYKHDAPTVWCVKCQTAIAQAEFENIEKQSSFNDISFHDEEGKELIISTTRPELIPACVALFAHPDDERYQYLKGKKAKVPLFDYKVPVLFDEAVAKDKGTGLMMVCTFGDKEDVEKWHKYDLDLRVVLEKNGELNNFAGPYEGMKIKEARAKIIEDLKEGGHLKGQEKITHNTNVHERCSTEIEFLKTSQWFVNVMGHKDRLIKAADQIDWHPSFMKKRYIHWVENLGWDWCISRQRHFGVPFPVWYEKNTGNIIVAEPSDLPVDPLAETPASYQGDPDNLIPEDDVMDTWATSSVSPQIALDYLGELSEEEFQKVFPVSLRTQAHDIIRTWAFYTIVKALYNHDRIPWKNIMVSGFVLDSQGRKLSKSKGNSIDPEKILELFGADAVRYAASSVKLGEDMPFKDKYVQTGKKLVNKIFNASKFAHMHLDDYDGSFEEEQLLAIDRWIIAKGDEAITAATAHLEEYEFAKARAQAERFFWTFCDYYLEMVKDRLYKPEEFGDESRAAGQMTLTHCIETAVKLFAPYLPYVTEEVWSWKLSALRGTDSVHLSAWPEPLNLSSTEDVQAGELACRVVSACRQEKNQHELSQKHVISELVIKGTSEQQELLKTVEDTIKMTVSAEKVSYADAEDLDTGITLAEQ